MEEILNKASEIGRLIQSTDEYLRYLKAREELNADVEAKKLYERYISMVEDVEARVKQGDIIENYSIEQMRDMEEQVKETPVIIEFITAQQEYGQFLIDIQKELQKR